MSEKSDRKRLQKEGAVRFATGGDRSAWAAHQGRRCLVGCHYCRISRMNLRSVFSFTPSPRTSPRWGKV